MAETSVGTNHTKADIVKCSMQKLLVVVGTVTAASSVSCCHSTDIHPCRSRSVPADFQCEAVVVWHRMSARRGEKNQHRSLYTSASKYWLSDRIIVIVSIINMITVNRILKIKAKFKWPVISVVIKIYRFFKLCNKILLCHRQNIKNDHCRPYDFIPFCCDITCLWHHLSRIVLLLTFVLAALVWNVRGRVVVCTHLFLR